MDTSPALSFLDRVYSLYGRAAHLHHLQCRCGRLYPFDTGLRYWYLLTLNVIVHFAFRYFSQDDAQFFDCFVVYTYKHDYYST